MSKDKYLSIFSTLNGGYCVYYPSNIFRNMRESAGSAILSYVNHVKVCIVVFQNLHFSTSDFASVESVCSGKRLGVSKTRGRGRGRDIRYHQRIKHELYTELHGKGFQSFFTCPTITLHNTLEGREFYSQSTSRDTGFFKFEWRSFPGLSTV